MLITLVMTIFTTILTGDALREEAKAGNLWNTLIFLCTGTSTIESAIVKGNSSSEKLFILLLVVRKIKMQQGAKVVVSHVSGEQMKDQGTNGVSCGQLKEGVSADQDWHPNKAI
jgi:hypothetical protein